MNKNIFNCLLAAFLGTASLCFTSCDDDDGPTKFNIDNTDFEDMPPYKMVTPGRIGVRHPVRKMTRLKDGDESTLEEYVFSYTDSTFSVKSPYGTDSYNYSFEENEGVRSRLTYNYNGMLAKVVVVDNTTSTEKTTGNYTYDEKGRILTETRDEYSIKYFWDKKKLTGLAPADPPSESNYARFKLIEFEYGEDPNPGIFFYRNKIAPDHFGGFYGRCPAYLPIAVKFTYSNNNVERTTFGYTFNADSTVNTITENGIGLSGRPYTEVYQLEY